MKMLGVIEKFAQKLFVFLFAEVEEEVEKG